MVLHSGDRNSIVHQFLGETTSPNAHIRGLQGSSYIPLSRLMAFLLELEQYSRHLMIFHFKRQLALNGMDGVR